MPDAASLWIHLDEERDALCALLRSADASALPRRPAVDGWSVIENVRHLVYAEELHFRRVLPRGSPWTPLGLPTGGRPNRRGVGTHASEDLDEVLAAWDEAHERSRIAVHGAAAGEDTDRMVDRNLRHLRSHARQIRRLIEAPQA